MPAIGIGISPHFQNWAALNWAALKSFNLNIEGHSFVAPTAYYQTYAIKEVLPPTYNNTAVGGSHVATMVARAALCDAKLVTETATHKNILVIWIGVNDIDEDDVGGGQITYDALKPYVLARVAAGWKCFVYTMTPSTNTGRGAQFEIERNVFNGLLKSDLHNDQTIFVLDTDTVPELCDPDDTDYFESGIHPTAAGHALAAALLGDKLDALSPDRNTTLTLPAPASTFSVVSTGTGAGIGLLKMTSSAPTVIQLTGGAKFYTDAAATQGETDIYVLMPTLERSFYIKCTSGTSTMYIDKAVLTSWREWQTPTNAPRLEGSIANLGADLAVLNLLGKINVTGSVTAYTKLTQLSFADIGANVTGSVEGKPLTYLRAGAGNSLSGSITSCTGLTYINVTGSNTLSGDISGHTALTYLIIKGNNTVGGDLGANNVVNGITFFSIEKGQFNAYTAGATWSNATVIFANGTGQGYDQTEISNMLIDMDDSADGPASKAIMFVGANASMADTNQGGIWGDFDGETSPSALAIAYKNLIRVKSNTVTLNGITVPGVSGDGTGFPSGFGDWYRS